MQTQESSPQSNFEVHDSVALGRQLLLRTSKPKGLAISEESGRVGAALVAVGGGEALFRHAALVSQTNVHQQALADQKAIDVRAAQRRHAMFAKMVEASCDGAVALAVLTDPSRAAELPQKTGFEYQDPTGYADELIGYLTGGSAADQEQAQRMVQVRDLYLADSQHLRAVTQASEAAREKVVTTRLSLRATLAEDTKFVREHSTKDHKARAHLKRKRVVKEAPPEAAPTKPAEAPASSPAASKEPGKPAAEATGKPASPAESPEKAAPADPSRSANASPPVKDEAAAKATPSDPKDLSKAG